MSERTHQYLELSTLQKFMAFWYYDHSALQ